MLNKNKKVKIAQVGTWHDHALPTLLSIKDLSDIYDFVGVAEPGDTICHAFDNEPKKVTVEELLATDDLDAVAIECEEEKATYYARMFVEKGVAVHIDKPGTQDIESFTELINLAKRKNVPLQMGYMYRYNPLIKKCMEDIQSGKLGEIYSIEAQMSVGHPDEKRKWLGKYKGGMTYFLGCHLIDLILQIQGMPNRVIPLNASTEPGKIGDAEDFGFAVLEYDNGSSFVKVSANETNGYERRQFVVTGTKGTFEIKPFETILSSENRSDLVSIAHVTYKSEVTDIWSDCSEKVISEGYNRYNPMMTDFAAFVRGEKENPYTYDYELKLFKLLMRCCGIQE